MNHSMRTFLFACAFAACASLALAQYDRPQDEREHRARLIERVLGDLDQARDNGRMDEGARSHLNQASRDLEHFRDNWANGNFDGDRLDDAIHNIDHVIGSDRIDGRDRDALTQDMKELREFREHHEHH